MRTVDSTYKNGAKQKIRDVAVKIETNAAEAKTITADKIISTTIQRSLTDGSFTIGNTPSDRLNAVVIDTDKLPKKTRVTISAAFDSSAYERIGRFYVDKCTRNGQNVTITAFDALSLTETEVKFGGKASKNLEKLEFPCTMQQMLDYIVTLKGMTCEFECQPFMVAKKPMKSETEYYTARELFGFIAGCHGCNAKMDYDGKLTFREFGKVAAEFTADNVLDMSVDDFEPFTVKGVLFTVGDDSIYIDDTPGSEYDAEADGIVQTNNPLATVEVAEYVWNKIGNLSYYGGSIKIRGEGILEPGDVVTVKNLKYPTDTTEYPVLITDISYSITRDGGFIETLSSAVSKKSSSNGGGASNAGKSGSEILGQIKFTAGNAYYGGEEYTLQRGNNHRIIAVSKGDKCSIIDTPFDAAESTAEVAAATAILKGLDGKATAEATFNVAQGESIWLFFTLDSTEDAVVDWGDGTTEAITNYSVYHTYTVSGTVTQKVTAPKATKATIRGESRENVLYIGGEITQVSGMHSYTKMVIWGNKIQQFSKGGWGSSIKYKCDMAFPPGAASLYGSWGNNVNYCYIPAACTTLSGMQSDSFENIEIESSGGELTPSGYSLFGSGGNYMGRAMNSISLPARVKISDKGYLELASGRALRYMRFESGHTTIPSSFMYSANKSYDTNVYSKMYVYIPKTVMSIGNSAFASPVHFVYEGTYAEWGAITKSDGFVTNGGTFELSCKNAPTDGGMRYENFESDIKNVGTKSEINAGAGIEIDINSNTVSVALDDNGGLSFANGKLRAQAASNDILGMVKQGSADLSIIGGFLSFLGIKSGHFSSADVADRTYSANLDSGFRIKSTDVLVALWERWGSSVTWHGISVFPFFGYSTSFPRKMWTLKDDQTITCPIENMRISTDDGVKVNFYMISKSEVLPYGYMVNWFIIKKISDM